jgi:transcriptional regulator with XRE-family HTH domain
MSKDFRNRKTTIKPPNMFAIGKNISVLTMDKKITQGSLARSVGMNDAMLSRRMNGVGEFSAYELYLIAKKLGVTMDSLMKGVEDGDT